MTLPEGYRVDPTVPALHTYQQLRVVAGLSAKHDAAAGPGLAGSLFGVQLVHGDEVIGMGRVIGDGGCFYQVVDIAVHPDHQGLGLGKAIMREICAWLTEHVPPSGYVSLIADGEARRLYAQFGFEPTAPASIGMAWWPNGR